MTDRSAKEGAKDQKLGLGDVHLLISPQCTCFSEMVTEELLPQFDVRSSVLDEPVRAACRGTSKTFPSSVLGSVRKIGTNSNNHLVPVAPSHLTYIEVTHNPHSWSSLLNERERAEGPLEGRGMYLFTGVRLCLPSSKAIDEWEAKSSVRHLFSGPTLSRSPSVYVQTRNNIIFPTPAFNSAVPRQPLVFTNKVFVVLHTHANDKTKRNVKTTPTRI
ncbi:uncharacterized protein B0T23DRAFT_395118 [Neurospora hispaniola]|uniref:Uncharacterized protein n=1 Tax=Neurospora hispaniola TaxID=588809 RepID=A0AAJ0IAS2_9PEZI|nr:hypothetical protein B0T23DRAFT_395118 [Neurospora hispaniola]